MAVLRAACRRGFTSRARARVTAAVWALTVSAALGGCSQEPGPTLEPVPTAEHEDPLWPEPPDQALPDGVADDLQAELQQYLELEEAPGATAAVVSTDGVWAGASGVDGAGVPLEPRSAFAIASVTKTFVAAEVLLLSARGEVDLDAPIAAQVELPFDAEGATVREVMGMRSGFPPDPSSELPRLTSDLDREWTVDDTLNLAVPGTHQGTRGGETDYNNLNFVALGALVEEVTGRPYADALRRDLIDPAGLDRVWVQGAEQPEPPLAIAPAPPGTVTVDADGPHLPSRAFASAVGAAGGMAADAPSVARWAHLLYGGHVIDPSLVRQMTAADSEDDWYGLGTVLFAQGEDAAIGHPGDIGVYHGIVAVWPATATSVAILLPGPAPVTLSEERTPWGLAQELHDVVTR